MRRDQSCPLSGCSLSWASSSCSVLPSPYTSRQVNEGMYHAANGGGGTRRDRPVWSEMTDQASYCDSDPSVREERERDMWERFGGELMAGLVMQCDSYLCGSVWPRLL